MSTAQGYGVYKCEFILSPKTAPHKQSLGIPWYMVAMKKYKCDLPKY